MQYILLRQKILQYILVGIMICNTIAIILCALLMVAFSFWPGFGWSFELSTFPWSWGELLWDALGVDAVVLFPLRGSMTPYVGVMGGGHSIAPPSLSSLVFIDFSSDSDSPLCLGVNYCWIMKGIHGLTLPLILGSIQYDLIKSGMLATK